jgi:hypothetical protein
MSLTDKTWMELQADLACGFGIVSISRIAEIYKKMKCPAYGRGRVWWYYKEDKKFAKDEGFCPRSHAPYSGFLVPVIGVENRGLVSCEYELDKLIVVNDVWPVEKCYPEVQWVTLVRLLSTPSLVEMFSEEDRQRASAIEHEKMLKGK